MKKTFTQHIVLYSSLHRESCDDGWLRVEVCGECVGTASSREDKPAMQLLSVRPPLRTIAVCSNVAALSECRCRSSVPSPLPSVLPLLECARARHAKNPSARALAWRPPLVVASHYGGVGSESDTPVGSCFLVGSSSVMAMSLRCRFIGRTYICLVHTLT
ncbi:hypothetical protein IG631_18079 [Alternaria alternata]|nr:hypothetical protein IG631_18079 [Alternaria alternata]